VLLCAVRVHHVDLCAAVRCQSASPRPVCCCVLSESITQTCVLSECFRVHHVDVCAAVCCQSASRRRVCCQSVSECITQTCVLLCCCELSECVT